MLLHFPRSLYTLTHLYFFFSSFNGKWRRLYRVICFELICSRVSTIAISNSSIRFNWSRQSSGKRRNPAAFLVRAIYTTIRSRNCLFKPTLFLPAHRVHSCSRRNFSYESLLSVIFRCNSIYSGVFRVVYLGMAIGGTKIPVMRRINFTRVVAFEK